MRKKSIAKPTMSANKTEVPGTEKGPALKSNLNLPNRHLEALSESFAGQ
jgi:hypothetical protein